ncbi:serine hydrolase domain-containing protein [Sphingomonas arenae]|uniref:serine hydrolase domain-containing protein n=1 Tax=Sphingomonas arenae TaxID=2812555 RepID=UPI001967A9CB|nr:serine hydrolase [Sphingomonas arenae]
MSRLFLASALLALTSCATVAGTQDDTGAEVGVAFDRAGDQGFYAEGLADPAARRGVSPDDPVRVASVSKLVVAIGVMKLVEQGRLSLDEDVSRHLGWSLRNPAFPQRPVSLRMLLSHTSSIRDHDDQYAIPLGGSVREVMADPRSWDSRHGPGEGWFTYSNMNFPVVGSVVERVTGERFDRWMRRELLEPMRIDGCFNWPTCSDEALARAVVLTQGGEPVRDDLGGKRPSCPVFVREGQPCEFDAWRPGENGALFAPQGGLRVSARGLARIGRMLLNQGELDGARILSPASVAELLRPQWRFDGRNGDPEGFYCSYGLAAQQIGTRARGCDDDAAGDGVIRVGHAGEAYGLRSGLWIDPERGTGIAYFRTGLADDTPAGRTGFRAAEERAFRRALALLPR